MFNLSSDEKDINEAKVSGGGAKSQMSLICENIGYKNDGWRHILDGSSNNNFEIWYDGSNKNQIG